MENRKGALDFKTDKIVGPALKQVFKDNNINTLGLYKDFIRYAISKRAIEKNTQGFQTGVNIKTANKFVKENAKFEKDYPRLQKMDKVINLVISVIFR